MLDMFALEKIARALHIVFSIIDPPYIIFGGLYYIDKVRLFFITINQLKIKCRKYEYMTVSLFPSSETHGRSRLTLRSETDHGFLMFFLSLSPLFDVVLLQVYRVKTFYMLGTSVDDADYFKMENNLVYTYLIVSIYINPA